MIPPKNALLQNPIRKPFRYDLIVESHENPIWKRTPLTKMFPAWSTQAHPAIMQRAAGALIVPLVRLRASWQQLGPCLGGAPLFLRLPSDDSTSYIYI